MAVHIFDLDGTLVYHGTNKPLPGAVEMLAKLRAEGETIALITRRGREFQGIAKYDYESIQAAARALQLPGSTPILTDIGSPRILYNDEGCSAVKRETNQEWE